MLRGGSFHQRLEFSGLRKQICDVVAKAEFLAAVTNVTFIANFDGRLARTPWRCHGEVVLPLRGKTAWLPPNAGDAQKQRRLRRVAKPSEQVERYCAYALCVI